MRPLDMPRFYLHICNGDGFIEDEEGQELPDLKAARDEAIRGLRGVMSAELQDGQLNMASFIEIEDDEHHLMMTVQFMDAVDIRTDRALRRPR